MAFYLKLATALCLAVAVPQSDPRLSLSAVSSAYAGRGRAVRRDLGGTLSIRCRAVGASPRSLRLVKSVGDETFTLAARGASPRKVMVDAVVGGRLRFGGTFPDSEAVIENLTAEDTGQYWCFYSGREPGFDLSLDQRGTGYGELGRRLGGPGGERDLRRALLLGTAVVIGLLAWIIHEARMCRTAERARRPDSAIYEDMRPTVVP
ncbi:uncharacterized protein ACO6RY_19092 [Pungitius sinensis]